jgi:hypothetical protein
MADWDWVVLRKVVQHTLNTGAAILSFVILSYLTDHGVAGSVLRLILTRIEGGVLVVLVLILGCQLIYDVLPEKMREIVLSKFVFA